MTREEFLDLLSGDPYVASVTYFLSSFYWTYRLRRNSEIKKEFEKHCVNNDVIMVFYNCENWSENFQTEIKNFLAELKTLEEKQDKV